MKTKNQIWRENHKEQLKSYERRWRKNNPRKSKIIHKRFEVKRKVERKRIRELKKQEKENMYF